MEAVTEASLHTFLERLGEQYQIGRQIEYGYDGAGDLVTVTDTVNKRQALLKVALVRR